MVMTREDYLYNLLNQKLQYHAYRVSLNTFTSEPIYSVSVTKGNGKYIRDFLRASGFDDVMVEENGTHYVGDHT